VLPILQKHVLHTVCIFAPCAYNRRAFRKDSMAPKLKIEHGNPNFRSPSIFPSFDTPQSPSTPPSLAAIKINSKNLFVYVKVENTGTVGFGGCQCPAALPAAWPSRVQFGMSISGAAATASQSSGGFTFKAAPSTGGDRIVGPGLPSATGVFFGAQSSTRAWAWSPDGRLFAYAYSNSGSNWFLKIVALQNFTRADGSIASPGTLLVNGSAGGFSVPWDKMNFGWAGSKAVVAKGPGFSGPTSALAYVACPASAGGAVYSVGVSMIPAQLDWDFLSSPCGWMVALMPRVSGGTIAPFIQAISTRTAQSVGFKQGNLPKSVSVSKTTATITTQHQSAFGVVIGGIPGSPILIDDPDCTFVAGGVVARVDRMKVSSLLAPTGGVVSVGQSAASILAAGESRWLQVPNVNPLGWANQGESHWCLVAQAFTTDGQVPQPWNPSVPSVPQFPNWLENCAQRNVDIT
jgi:hypothetical protein